jgi:hypothetical protein
LRIHFLALILMAPAAFAASNPGCDLKQAGFKSPKEFEKFFAKLQTAAAARDEAALAKMANYPFRIGDKKRIKNEAEMKKKFASVFTSEILVQITAQKRSSLFCDYQGARIGEGRNEIWIQEIEGVVVISSIHK